LLLVAVAGAMAAPAFLAAQAPQGSAVKEWPVEWGGRVRDPYVAPDGKVWFVGQEGNYIANFDPATQAFKRFTVEEGTHPHNLVVDERGFVWYAGNRNGRIGRLDPATGQAKTFPTGDARDPHTLVFDGKGSIWFTSQGSNRIGRLNMESGKVDLVAASAQPSNPYGIVLDGDGRPLVALLRTNTIVRVDPATLQLTTFRQGDPAARSRRVEWTPDGIWYADEARGFLGRIDPATGEVKEWQAPGGAGSRPYALTKDDQGRIWFSETGPVKRLVGFDPRTEKFTVHPVSGTVRHMMFDRKTGSMWFGTDANNLARLSTRAGAS
jgi:virginiamycin B lyase